MTQTLALASLAGHCHEGEDLRVSTATIGDHMPGRGLASRATPRWLIPVLGLLFAFAAEAPVWARHRMWSRLYWFGDDWDLMNRMEILGFRRWLFDPFAESFCPVGKLLYGVMFVRPGANYIDYMWMTQLLRIIMFALIALAVRRLAGDKMAAGYAGLALLFLINPAGIEIIAWAPQLLTALAHTFFAGLLLIVAHAMTSDRPLGTRGVVGVLVLQACCSLSFTRGVALSGVVALALCFAQAGLPRLSDWRGALQRLRAGAIFFVVPIACLLMSLRFARVRNPYFHLSSIPTVLNWALRFFSLNPFVHIMQIERQTIALVVCFAALKIAMAVYAYRLGTPVARLALFALLAEIASSLAGGMGRFHTGAGAAVASRYQDVPALSFLLLFTVVVASRWRPIGRLFAFTLVGPLLLSNSSWRLDSRNWAQVRGLDIRHVVLNEPNDDAPMPYVPFITVGRARELVAKYDLK